MKTKQSVRTRIGTKCVKLGVFAFGVAAAISASADGGKLTYLTWSGYELPQFHQSYLKAHPEGVDISVFGDDDEAFAKVKSGFAPDIAHPCIDKIPRWREANLIQPIDPKRIPNFDKIFPVLRNMPGVYADGKLWMVPWDWGNTSILYRTDKLPNPEQSWSMLWDKKLSGKIATIDAVHDTVIVAAMLSGVDPFNMSASNLAKVKAKLQEQRPLLRTYTNDMTSVEQALASGELSAAMTWNASEVALKKRGVPVKFMAPKEGMLTWVCGIVLMKNAKQVDKAYDFINARLQPDAGQYLISSYGYGSSSKEAFARMTDKQLNDLSLPRDPEVALKKTVITTAMKNADAASAMFEAVKSGQ
ncbi:ABC transporter substrate-binding protein [Paraburkholderia sp. GAS334]|uniref:ABC transporter substrate-binding protein n=1 Tax=Paraburkholderia sp. GAS334 TaxID=3035131 RepID=UPI003D22FAD9